MLLGNQMDLTNEHILSDELETSLQLMGLPWPLA